MNIVKNILLTALIAVSGSAIAAEPGAEGNITDLLKLRLNVPAVGEVKSTPVGDLKQVAIRNEVVYLSQDGRYLITGTMFDLQSGVNLTKQEVYLLEQPLRDKAKAVLGGFDVSKLIVFPASGEKAKTVLNVFTDTSCGYCQKLHQELPQLQSAGIEVRYFPFARGGSRGPGYDTLRRVWCGKDPVASMNVAKGVSEGYLSEPDCELASIVDEAYSLGNELGVEGTPALFTSEGHKIDGYVSYDRLIPMLLGGNP